MSSSNSFVEHIRGLCQKKPGKIGLPEATDIRILRVALQLIDEGSFQNVVTFNRSEVTRTAKKYGLHSSPLFDQLIFAEENFKDLGGEAFDYYENYLKNKDRPHDEKSVQSYSENVLSQTGVLLHKGYIDSALSGAIFSTADVIRAAISSVGLAKGVRTVSGSFFMNGIVNGEERTYLYADCGVVIDPKPRQLVDIAHSSVESFKKVLPLETPRVAFLSFSTKGSAEHEQAHKMAEAYSMFSLKHPEIESDGEIQFDAAVDLEIRKRKSPSSKLTGDANIFIFPDLDAGNICYKATQRLAGFDAYGPLLQGVAKPFSDLSRGSTEDDILCSAYLNYLLG